ncbi:MAG: WecB/TagA/CpsF family glycosyltransferase [Cellulosilyticum sp.]|nr:WecB/TagA/CpsF family glycosyltransferase [Cellulosilyticum sp.]
MKKTVDVLGVSISNVTMAEATQKVREFVKSDSFHSIYTPNPEIVMLAKQDPEFHQILEEADLVVPDGIGVVIASKIKKNPLPERVAGYDLVQNTMKDAVKEGYKYYFFGSKPGTSEAAAEKMRETYPGIQIVGTRNGYFKPEDEAEIIADINNSGANILLVALGAPKQEKWIEANKHLMPNVRVAVGVGGSLDVMSGNVKRAPETFQKLGLEWFYRLLKEPTRFKRMLVLPKFLVKVIFYKG